MYPFEKVGCIKLLLTSQGLPINNNIAAVSMCVIYFFKPNIQANQFLIVIVFVYIVQYASCLSRHFSISFCHTVPLTHSRVCACFCSFCCVHAQVTMTSPMTKHLHLMPGSTSWPFENSYALTNPRNVLSRVLTVISTGRRMHIMLHWLSGNPSVQSCFPRLFTARFMS